MSLKVSVQQFLEYDVSQKLFSNHESGWGVYMYIH